MSSWRFCTVVRRSARLLSSLSRRPHSLHKPNHNGRPALRGIHINPLRSLGVLNKRYLVVEASTAATHEDGWGRSRPCAVNVGDDRGMLTIKWADGETSAFHAVWLRHNCQCPSCITTSNQKTIYPSMLNPNVAITSTTISGETIEMSWSCGHHGYVSADWLKKHQYPDASKTTANTEPTVAMEVPCVDGSQIEAAEVLWSWLRNLNEYGVCLLTNLSAEVGTVKKIAKLVYNIQPTIYNSETFEVITEDNPANHAYTTEKLHLHMDQVFYESPPGLQLLHCIRFDPCVEGGESILLDAFPVVEELRAKHPEHFDVLTRVPATTQRIHYNRKEPVELIYQRPHVVVDKSGEITAINWNASLDGPLSVPKEDVLPYYEAYHCLGTMFEDSQYKLSHRLQPGEIMTFNNRRMLHSRTAFKLNGGVRHLQGTYVNIDEFKSKFRVLCNQLGHQDYPVKRVFNHQSA